MLLLRDIIGYTATVIGTSMMIPQILKIITTKKSGDVSLIMTVLFILNCLLWFTYGWLIGAPPVILGNGIGIVIGVVQFVLRQRYARSDVPG